MAHDCNGQEQPLVGGYASSASGFTNSFHVSMKRSREGMGQENGRPVAAVYTAPRRVMNSDTCRKPPLGTFKSISNPINSGAGKRTQAYWFTASICLLRMSGSWATSVASYHRALAKGNEATHSPRSWEAKGSRKLLAPLKRVHERHTKPEKGVPREKHNKSYTREKGGWEWGEWGDQRGMCGAT